MNRQNCNVKLEVLGNETLEERKALAAGLEPGPTEPKPSRVNYQEKSADPCIVTANRLMSHSQSSTSVEIVIFFAPPAPVVPTRHMHRGVGM
jgi:hypothetical protein